MITAVDTSVLLDVFLPDRRYGPRSAEWLRGAYDAGAIVICDIVYAELVPAFPDGDALDDALRRINAARSPVDASIAHDAGRRWRRYTRSGGRRTRILTDFLIGAHAVGHRRDLPHPGPALLQDLVPRAGRADSRRPVGS